MMAIEVGERLQYIWPAKARFPCAVDPLMAHARISDAHVARVDQSWFRNSVFSVCIILSSLTVPSLPNFGGSPPVISKELPRSPVPRVCGQRTKPNQALTLSIPPAASRQAVADATAAVASSLLAAVPLRPPP